MKFRFELSLLAAASSVVLAGCDPAAGAADAPRAPAVRDAPVPVVYRSGVDDGAARALTENARLVDRSVGQRRPDYAFRYQAEQPLAWRAPDESTLYAEPVKDGYRSYYYGPGAERPYLIRDTDVAYVYGPDGRLAALFNPAGAAFSEEEVRLAAPRAAEFQARGRALRRFGLDDGYRVALSDRVWSKHAPAYAAAIARWRGADADPSRPAGLAYAQGLPPLQRTKTDGQGDGRLMEQTSATGQVEGDPAFTEAVAPSAPQSRHGHHHHRHGHGHRH